MGAAIALSSLVGGIGYHSPSISGFKPRKERGSPLEEDERREGGFGMRNERERERGGGSMTLEGSAVRSLFGNGISLDRSRD